MQWRIECMKMMISLWRAKCLVQKLCCTCVMEADVVEHVFGGRCVSSKVCGPYVVVIINRALVSQEWTPKRYVSQ